MHKQEHDISVLADALAWTHLTRIFMCFFPCVESNCQAYVCSTSIASVNIQHKEER